KDASYELMEEGGRTRITRKTTIVSRLSPAWYWRKMEKIGVETEHEYLFEEVKRKLNGAKSHVTRNVNLSALCFRPRGVPGIPGHLAGPTTAAHTIDVGYECYLGHLARRFDRDCRSPAQQAEHDSWFHRCGVRDNERRRWLRDHRSDVEDVQAEGSDEERIVPQIYADERRLDLRSSA